ncbi:hypothetical protein PGT21_034505 [Puccinia graminis f. sp. tritici]|uniref:Uncharacterized protein n=1 Tax=Puccinia graminis f. sp. tritici TaxID=56615 RepID=A0A5B0NFW5_PUCGR|nr:hypothetical protein PGT21_034505 [Puccinia graminis f. sp. tritici]
MAVQRRRETRSTLATLLGKRNPHSPNNRNYTRAFFLRQWSAQRSFQEDHTDVEEARMKKLVALYERENVIDLLRTLLASESEVRELLDSIKLESEKLKEEVENLSSGDMPAGNVEERKMRLLLWSAKSELFVQAVHLMAERQPLCDAKNTRSRLGTRLKEKVFKAINNRRPAIDKLIDEYNKKYSQYKLKFPDCAGSTVGDNGLLSYETLSSLSLDDAFWNDGLFHHSDAPWAIDPNVREGIRCMLVLDRIQEEFELISQEVVRSMSWAIGLHDQLVKYIGYLQDRINLMSNNSSEVPIDHIDAIHLPGLNRKEKANVIKIELGNRLASHNELVEEWSENLMWLWDHCQPVENQSFLNTWKALLQDVRKEGYANSINSVDIDETLEDDILHKVADDGEDANDVPQSYF